MPIQLAAAYVPIIPSLDGMAKSIQSQLGGVAGTAGKNAGSTWADSFGGALKTVGSIAAGAAATVAGVIGGIAVSGGISRALSIENAQAKLTGLGHSAESVTEIMKNSLAAVKGTAFGLGDAAGVAAAAVASGVKPGQELQRTLSLVGDAATIAGTDLSSMGSIFNKVAASGKLQGDTIAQLADAGVPALQLVADQLGVTAEEASKLASQGKIDFATFQNAIEAGMGGAALASGGTFVGALANVKSALGRLGAIAATPALAGIKGIFNDAIPAIDAVAGKIAPIVEALAGKLAPIVESLSTRFFALFDGLDFSKISETISSLSGALGPVLGVLAGALGPLLSEIPFLGKAFQSLTGPVGLFIGLIAQMFAESSILRDAFSSAFSTIGDILKALGPVFASVSQIVGQLAGVLGDVLGSAINALLPLVLRMAQLIGPILSKAVDTVAPILVLIAKTVGEMLTTALDIAIPLIDELAKAVFPILQKVLEALAPLLLEVASAIMPLVLEVFRALSPLLGAAIPLLVGIVNALVPLIDLLLSLLIPAIEALLPVVEIVFGVVTDIISKAVDYIQAIIAVFVSALKGDWSGAWEGLKAVAQAGWDLIKSIISGALTIVKTLISTNLEFIKTIWNAVWSFVSERTAAAWDALKSIVSNGVAAYIGFITGIPGQIQSAFAGAGSWLLESGRKIIQGLVDGIKGMAQKVKDAVSDVLSSARDLLPFSPAKEGPFSGKGWSLYSGQSIVRALADGMLQERDMLASATNSLVSGVAGPLSGIGSGIGPANPANFGAMNNFYLTTETPEETSAAVARRLADLGA